MEKDIIISKDGKKEVAATPVTDKAKKIFEKEKCKYGFTVPATDSYKILTWAATHNLSVESQVPITIPERPSLTNEQLQKVFPSVPANFLPRTLFAIGTSKFKGDTLDKISKDWSVNDQFDKGVEYPVYDSEGLFVVGKDGKGYKMIAKAWTQIKQY